MKTTTTTLLRRPVLAWAFGLTMGLIMAAALVWGVGVIQRPPALTDGLVLKENEGQPTATIQLRTENGGSYADTLSVDEGDTNAQTNVRFKITVAGTIATAHQAQVFIVDADDPNKWCPAVDRLTAAGTTLTAAGDRTGRPDGMYACPGEDALEVSVSAGANPTGEATAVGVYFKGDTNYVGDFKYDIEAAWEAVG